MPIAGLKAGESRMAAYCAAGIACALWAALAAETHAQTFPARPVRLVVTYTAGGPADIAARALAQKLAGMWGQQVVVDNRAGAGGIIGTGSGGESRA